MPLIHKIKLMLEVIEKKLSYSQNTYQKSLLKDIIGKNKIQKNSKSKTEFANRP